VYWSTHWDFALIFIFFATAIPLLGQRRIRRLLAQPSTTKAIRLRLYSTTIVFQWLATALIYWRVRARGISAAQVGISIPNAVFVAAVSVALCILIFGNQYYSLHRMSQHPEEVRGSITDLASRIFPQDSSERIVFVFVVVTVAICEEFIYRGFMQQVFHDWSGGSVVAAVLGSSLMFAIAHLYQGRRGIFATLVAGLLFSSVRAWTGSLLPAVLGHFIADITAGFMAPSALKKAANPVDQQSA
jgi:uncharacterized protein